MLRGVIAAAQVQLTAILEEQNNALPVGHLPDEILLTLVLERACFRHRTQEYYIELKNLRLVCRRWALLITSSPSMWARTSWRLPISGAEAVLRNSRDIPIHISCLCAATDKLKFVKEVE